MFKGFKIRLEEDYNAEICVIRKKLVEYMWEARRRGKHAVLVGDKIQISGALFDLQYCIKNFKTGERNIKAGENKRAVVSQGMKYDVEKIRKDKDNQKEEKEIEEEKVGDKSRKTKEREKATNNVGLRTGYRREKQDAQQATSGCEEIGRENRGRERGEERNEGNLTVKGKRAKQKIYIEIRITR